MATEITAEATSQSNIDLSIALLQENIMMLASGVVWKNSSRAATNEVSANLYLAELFILANRQILNFDIIKAFPRVVLTNLGVKPSLVDVYAADKNKIPVDDRDMYVNEYMSAFTSKNSLTGLYGYLDKATGLMVNVYEEKNNYYRELMGLPDYGTTRFIYNTDSRWSTTTPIHEMNLIDIIEMEQLGIIAIIQNNNPSDTYLKYLGSKRIDYYTSRSGNKFELLGYTSSGAELLDTTFEDEYLRASYMMTTVYYSKTLGQNNELYENFLAMSILFMTIQSLFNKYLYTDITRDFFDVESLKLIYDSYEVPFYSEIPLEYHVKIVKNINRLLSYKGSSNVFFDLFNIFDLASMNIYSYYLTKTHRVDQSGRPIFETKKDEDGNDMLDSDGDVIMDDSVFDIAFARVQIYDDPALAISDPSSKVLYDSVTVTDPYWIEDAELQEKLRSEHFNFTESKYLGIQTIFDLMKITFENAYLFRMITDNKELTDEMDIVWVEANLNVSLYGLIIYLASVYCRHYGYEGIITNNIPAVMDTLGYNFENISEILKNDIMTDPTLSNDTILLETLAKISVSNIDSINTSMIGIEELREYIINKYTEATSRDEFNLYKALYDSILTSREVTAVYTDKSTGLIYHSFIDILLDTSPELMQRYLLLSDDDLINEMTLVINQLEKMIDSLKYMTVSIGIGSSSMINALYKILQFFKSAKAELVDYDITYVITARGVNFIKAMDMLKSVHTDSNDMEVSALVGMLHNLKEISKLIADYNIHGEILDVLHTTYSAEDIMILQDILIKVSDQLGLLYAEDIWFIDFLHDIRSKLTIKSYQLLSDMESIEEDKFKWHEHRYIDTIKDVILTLVDRLSIYNGDLNIAFSELLMIDGLLSGILAVNDKAKLFSIMDNIDDIIELLTMTYRSDANFAFDEVRRSVTSLNISSELESKTQINHITEILSRKDDVSINYDSILGVLLVKHSSDISMSDMSDSHRSDMVGLKDIHTSTIIERIYNTYYNQIKDNNMSIDDTFSNTIRYSKLHKGITETLTQRDELKLVYSSTNE